MPFAEYKKLVYLCRASIIPQKQPGALSSDLKRIENQPNKYY